MAPDFHDLEIDTGFLVDTALELAFGNGFLIERGTWASSGIKHASYLLRVGREVEYPHEGGIDADDRRSFRGKRLGANESVELPPGKTALVKPIERLRLPDDVVAFTIPRGFLFAEALLVATSYIDPGFGDDFYIPITNISDRLIRLPVGTEVARVFFCKLSTPVRTPYTPSSTTHLVEEMESLPARATPTPEECRAMSPESLLTAVVEVTPAGAEIAELLGRESARHGKDAKDALQEIRRLRDRHRLYLYWLTILSLAWPTLILALVLSFQTVRSALGSGSVKGLLTFIISVISGLIAAAIYEAVRARRSRRKQADE